MPFKLHIALAHFHPAFLRSDPPPSETYGHDADVSYVVAQPFLLLETAADDQKNPRDYISNWTPASLAATSLELIGEAKAGDIISGKLRPVPVPFPPGTKLSLALKGKRASGTAFPDWSDERQVGATTAAAPVDGWDQLSGDGPAGWPAFAVLSNARAVIQKFDDLDNGTQKAEALQGLLAVFAEMQKLWDSAGNTPAPDIRGQIWTSLVRPNITPAMPLSDTAAWLGILAQNHSPGLSNAAWAYNELIERTFADEPHASLPRAVWTADKLNGQGGLFLAGLVGRSYLHALWQELKDSLAKYDDDGFIKLLGRMFGFGERLAWPVGRVDGGSIDASKRFMVLRTSLAGTGSYPTWIQPETWCATNLVSLAGQVFRYGPFNVTDPPSKLDAVTFKVGTVTLGKPADLADEINHYNTAIANAAATAKPITITASLARERGAQTDAPSAPDRLIVFAARTADMPQVDPTAVPTGRVFIAVPDALLDVVDDLPRFSTGDIGVMPQRSAPRRGLFRSEVLAPETTLRGATAFYRRHVNLTYRAFSPATGNVFAVTPADDLAVREQMVDEWLVSLARGDASAPPAALWLPQAGASGTRASTAVVPLSAASVIIDRDGVPLIIDPDPSAATSLTKLLSQTPGFGRAALLAGELVFAVKIDQPFDLLELGGGAPVPRLSLQHGAMTRIGRSADRLMQGMGLTWNVTIPLDRAHDPFVDQAADTNKLRLTLVMTGGATRALSNPDAQLPLGTVPPPGNSNRPWWRSVPLSPTGPQAGYWLAEHFDQDASIGTDEVEETRFRAWVHAGEQFKLDGYVEHQYGHRLAIQPLGVKLSRATNIENLGATSIASIRPGDPQSKDPRPLPLIVATENQATRKLLIYFASEPVRLALARHASGASLDAAAAERDPNADLRSIYRALAELRDAMRIGTAHLVIEPWIFSGEQALASYREGKGSIFASGLIAKPPSYVALPLPTAGTGLDRVLGALDGSFADFVKVLTAVIAVGDPQQPWHVLLDDFDTRPLGRTASLLRIGLELSRPSAVTADTDWALGAFIPLADDGAAEAGSVVADNARTDLIKYFGGANSQLKRSLAWLNIREKPADSHIVGLGGPTLLNLAEPLDPVDSVIDLFYFPHAFALPEAHPALGDRQATFEFAAFLLQLADDVLAGRPVSDRIALDTRPAAGVAQLRRDLRGLLEQQKGIADQVMQMWRPVAPSADDDALNKFARAVLAELDTIMPSTPRDDRPMAFVRSMVVESPSLYSDARGIAIIPVKTEVPGLPVELAPYNHSTWSDELSEVELTKTLIGDYEQEPTDTDQFPLTAFRGGPDAKGVRRRYLVDVLREVPYDDTIEIVSTTYKGIDRLDAKRYGEKRSRAQLQLRGGAFARRGDDALQDPTARDEKVPGSIEANVVHVFPHWRVRQPSSPDPGHDYYLLPERRVPTQPRGVDAFHPADGSPAKVGKIAVVVPPPPQSGVLPKVSLTGQWRDAYEGSIADLDQASVRGEKTAPSKIYKRIRPAAHPGTPAAKNLPRVRGDDATLNGGWHLLTTSLSHFWFELDLPKPNKSLVENLDEDVYEVEIEMWSGTPPAPPPAGQTPTLASSDDRLLEAFTKWRAASSGGVAGSPSKVVDLVAGLRNWFLQPGAPQMGQALLRPLVTPASAAVSTSAAVKRSLRTFRVSRGRDGWFIREVNPVSQDPALCGLGALTGYEILAQPATPGGAGPLYDATVEEGKPSVLVRITVLDDPFHISRARLRILRNWRDVDGDNVPDIDEAFRLTGKQSDWNTEGRQPWVVGPDDFARYQVPPQGCELRVIRPGQDAAAEQKRWDDAIDVDDTGQGFDYGEALPSVLAVNVFQDTDDGKAKNLWETGPMLSADFMVSGVAHRFAPDTSPRFGAQGKVATITSLDSKRPQQILPSVAANSASLLMHDMKPMQIKSLSVVVDAVWRDAENMPVLSVTFPMKFVPRQV
jgi:hypothetical protein